MTVAELQKKLAKLPPYMEVLVENKIYHSHDCDPARYTEWLDARIIVKKLNTYNELPTEIPFSEKQPWKEFCIIPSYHAGWES
jgi:hypothetical protein